MRFVRIVGNKNFLQIFFALLFVALVMFISNYLVFKRSIAEISDRVNEKNRFVVNSIIQSIEDALKEMNGIIYSLHTVQSDPANYDNNSIDMAKVYDIQRNVATLSTSMDYLEEIVIYYPGSNLAITSGGTIDFQTLFTNKYRHRIYGPEYWKSLILSDHPVTVFPAIEYEVMTNSSRAESKNLMMMIGSSRIKLSHKNILLMIDVNKLLEHVNQKVMMEGTALIVMDRNKNVIFSTEQGWNLLETLNEIFQNAGQGQTLKKKDFEYHLYQSDYSGFIYIDKTPYRFTNIQSVARANQYIMIIAVIAVLLISATLSLLLYRPVKSIVRLIGDEMSKGTDFRNIYNRIIQIQEENKAIRTQMNFIEGEIRRGVFLHALDKFSHTREFEKHMQKYFTDFFQERHFLMVSIVLKTIEEEKPTEVLHIEEMSEFIEKGVLSSLHHAVVFHAGNLNYLALISIGQMQKRDRVYQQISEFIIEAQDNELKDYTVIGAMSRTYASTIQHCYDAYRDLLECYMNRNIASTYPLTDINAIRYTTQIYFPLDEIDRLSNHLVSGDESEALSLIDHIFAENMRRNIHYHQLLHIAVSIFYHLIRLIDSPNEKQKEIADFHINFTRKLDQAIHAEAIRQLLVQTVTYVGEKIAPAPTSKLTPSLITQYIAAHYMENLYLDHMAETFDTSPKYFSSYFKKTFNVNFVEYLNKVRINHAKELLRHTDLTIAEIGERTGYMNATTFTSTFKKYQGITPSEYRKKPVD